MSLSKNCFMLRAVVWNRKRQDLYQVYATGTLYEVFAKLFAMVSDVSSDGSMIPDEPQIVVITKLDDNTCIEDATLEELSSYVVPEGIDIEDLKEEIRKTYEKVYDRDYAPPKIMKKYPCITICENEDVQASKQV